ncbi:MAG: hypothetical protein N2652_11755 [Kiritimatiellae bacterium]|nr:hypothetical protein [Kiritimatiellia bacterium]
MAFVSFDERSSLLQRCEQILGSNDREQVLACRAAELAAAWRELEVLAVLNEAGFARQMTAVTPFWLLRERAETDEEYL